MRLRLIGMIAASLGLAVGAASMTRTWLEGERAAQAKPAPVSETPDPAPVAKVLVAAAELPAGRILKPGDLRWQSWPEDGVADSYFVRAPDRESESPPDLAGAVIRQGVAKGEPFTERRVVRPGEQGFLAAMLKPGHRAISVPVDATSGLAGLIFPGDRVDVILTHTVAGEQNASGAVRRVSETVLGDIRVMALDQRTDERSEERTIAKTATLELSPKQAERVSLARALGSLSLSLRPIAREGAREKTRPSFTLDSQISAVVSLPPSEPAAPKAADSITVVRGSSVRETALNGEADQ